MIYTRHNMVYMAKFVETGALVLSTVPTTMATWLRASDGPANVVRLYGAPPPPYS